VGRLLCHFGRACGRPPRRVGQAAGLDSERAPNWIFNPFYLQKIFKSSLNFQNSYQFLYLSKNHYSYDDGLKLIINQDNYIDVDLL
jgi:hypothetical protein